MELSFFVDAYLVVIVASVVETVSCRLESFVNLRHFLMWTNLYLFVFRLLKSFSSCKVCSVSKSSC